MRVLLPIVFLLFDAIAQAALPPPELRCVTVNSDGTITLAWDLPAGNQNEFINYSIYSSTFPNGPYAIIDSVTNFNTQIFTDGASLGRVYYFLQTKFDDGSGVTYSASSDTLSNIFLNVTSAGGNNLPPLLNWNPLKVPNLPSNLGKYYIFRKKNFLGNWQLVDSTSYGNENYTDLSIVTCSDTLYYYVQTFDNLPCFSSSNIDGELFQEKTPPTIPVLDSASVDTSTGFVKVGWQPSGSPDVAGYIITHNLGGTFVRDTVFGDSIQYYLINTVNANSQSIPVTVAAFDTCGNTSAFSSTAHTTMLVNVTENLCDRQMILDWSAYQGFSNISQYDIYFAQDNAGWRVAGSVPGTETSFVHEGLNNLSTYCYVVVANSLGKTSHSNIICQSFAQLGVPLYHYNTYVSVNEDGFVEAELITDTSADVRSYQLKRAYQKDGAYIIVDEITEATDTFIIFIDSTARPDQNPYYYKIDAIDSCNQTVVSSNISRTIKLNIEENLESYFHNLTWNKYEGWDSLGFGVHKYRILRSFDPDPLLPIDSVGATELDFLDPYFEIRADGGTFCYQIEAHESPNNWLFIPSSSLSNQVCIKKEPKVFVPTVFTPNSDGKNDVFLPEIQFVDAANYQMTIFDRWGNPIVEIADPRIGWDGTINGVPAPTGGYVYFISYTTPKGSLIEKRGGIALYR